VHMPEPDTASGPAQLKCRPGGAAIIIAGVTRHLCRREALFCPSGAILADEL
jgi:hypothetical protein